MDKFLQLRSKAEKLAESMEKGNSGIQGYDLKTLLHELDVYRIELELQNEELRESRNALEQSRQEFFELFEFAPIGYAVLDGNGMICQINQTGASLFGAPGERLKGMRMSSFALPPGIRFMGPFAKVLSEHQPQSAEVEFVREGGGRFWALLDFSFRMHNENAEPEVLCAFRDISERKSSEQELAAYRHGLEEMVRQRTKDLQESNIRLEQEISIRRQSEEKIAESLKEKEILLREIHHRVKNNMQVIISLLRHQSRKIQSPEVADVFRESQERIRAMSMIHETLYQQKSLSRIDLKDYLSRLGNSLIRGYARSGLKIRFWIETGTIDMDIDQAVPCGIIVNEMLSNALKYAFPETCEGEIRITARSLEENRMELTVSDNGRGLPESVDPHNCTSMGLATVMNLAKRQLGADVQICRKGGTAFTICFPLTHRQIIEG